MDNMLSVSHFNEVKLANTLFNNQITPMGVSVWKLLCEVADALDKEISQDLANRLS